MNAKKNILKIVLHTIVYIFALYGLILLIRKIMVEPEAKRMTKKELSSKFFIEPFRTGTIVKSLFDGTTTWSYSYPAADLNNDVYDKL
jgi:hypothetical protein